MASFVYTQSFLIIYWCVSLQFISAIESPLKAAGYNVQVINVVAAAGSILVTSTTEFLDGSTTGAADFTAALSDSTSVSALFPSSVYGTVAVTSVTTESVSNPSKARWILLLSLVRHTQKLSFTSWSFCRWSRSPWSQQFPCSSCSCGIGSFGLLGALLCNFSRLSQEDVVPNVQVR